MLGTVWSLIRAFRWRTTPIVACYGHMNRLIHVGWPGVLNGIFPFMQKTAALSEQHVLDELMPELIQYIDPLALLPYLQRHHLVTPETAQKIEHPNKIDAERTRLIVNSVRNNPKGLHVFLQCLQEEPSHPGHSYLARSLQFAMKNQQSAVGGRSPWVHGLLRRDQVPPHRKLLFKIAQKLSPLEIEQMTFLAMDLMISQGPIENGRQLITALEANGLLGSGNFMFLFDSLITIERLDLVEDVAHDLWDVPHTHPAFRVLEQLHKESPLKCWFDGYKKTVRNLTRLAEDEKFWDDHFSHTFEKVKDKLHDCQPTVTGAVDMHKVINTLEKICQCSNKALYIWFVKFVPTQSPEEIREPIQEWQRFYSKLEEVWDTFQWRQEDREEEHNKRNKQASHPIGEAITEASKCLMELAQGMLNKVAIEAATQKLQENLHLVERAVYIGVYQLLYFVIPWLSAVVYLAAPPRAELAPFRARLQAIYAKNKDELQRMTRENKECIEAVENLTLWQKTLQLLVKYSEHNFAAAECQDEALVKVAESKKRTFYSTYIQVAKNCVYVAKASLDQYKEEIIEDLVKSVQNEAGREVLRNAIRNKLTV